MMKNDFWSVLASRWIFITTASEKTILRRNVDKIISEAESSMKLERSLAEELMASLDEEDEDD